MQFHRLILVLAAVAFPLALAACGGGTDVHVVNPPSSTVVTPGAGGAVIVDD